jgi:hypothetical protein
MDRKDFYYRQRVLESELDSGFDACESADVAQSVDLDFVARTPPAAKADFGGIMWGLEASLAGGLDVLIDKGAAYGEAGKRAATPSDLTVTLSNEGSTQIGQGGTGDGAAISLATNEECWITIFISYDRLLSEQRYDGYNNLVYFTRDESFYFYIKKGVTVTPIGSLTQGHKPARESLKQLIADLHLKNTGGGIFIDSIDTGLTTQRTEWYFDYAATNLPNKRIHAKYNIRDALAQMLEYYNDHIAGLDDKHPAGDIPFTPVSLWADTTGLVASDVNGAINEVVSDLAQTQAEGAGSSGTDKVGTEAKAGAAGSQAYTSPLSLAQGTLQAVLESMQTAINSRVFRGGDDGIAGRLAPAANGTALGVDGGNAWDAYLRDLKLAGSVKSHLIPVADDLYDLGAGAQRWRDAFIASTLKVDGLADLNGDVDIEGWVDVLDTLDVHGAAHLFSTLLVDGVATAAGLVVNGDSALNGKTTITAKDGKTAGLVLLADPTQYYRDFLASVSPENASAVAQGFTISKMGHLGLPSLMLENFTQPIRTATANPEDHLGPQWRAAANVYFDDFTGGSDLSPTANSFRNFLQGTVVAGGFQMTVDAGLAITPGSVGRGCGIITGAHFQLITGNVATLLATARITSLFPTYGAGEVGLVATNGATRVFFYFTDSAIYGAVRGLDGSWHLTSAMVLSPFGEYVLRLVVNSSQEVLFQVSAYPPSGPPSDTHLLSLTAGQKIDSSELFAPYALSYEVYNALHTTTGGSNWLIRRIYAADMRRQDVQ